MNEQDALRVLGALLDRQSAAWMTDSGWVRFRSQHGAAVWETACRVCEDVLLIYGRFPFRCRDAEEARKLCEAFNRQLVRGALYLAGDGSPVYRCTAELDDIYTAEQRINAALRYSAQVVAHCWGKLSGT